MAGNGTNGSNDLNMVLKAKVVELKVKLDYKGSKLPDQVDGISKKLENKPVKLKIKLDSSLKELNKQLKGVSTSIQESKSVKPIRVGIEIDVKGSASNIKKQLKEVHDTVESFNRKYGEQLNRMRQQTQKAQLEASKATSTGLNIKNDASVQNFNNIKDYTKQLKEAQRILNSKLPSGQKGLFSSFEMKDAKGNLLGFIASLEKANGVVEKIRYDWNKDKNQFQIIDRSTATQTEKQVKRAVESLETLQGEIKKTGKESVEFQKEYDRLLASGKNGKLELNSDMVKEYKNRLNAVKEQVAEQTKLRDLEREELKLIREIRNASKGTDGQFASQTKDLLDKVRDTKSLENYKNVRVELGNLKDAVSKYKKEQQETTKVEKEVVAIQKELNRLLDTSVQRTGELTKANLEEIKSDAGRARTTKELIEVQQRLNKVQQEERKLKVDDSRIKALEKLKSEMHKYAELTGTDAKTIMKWYDAIEKNISGNLSAIESKLRTYQYAVKQAMDSRALNELNRKASQLVTSPKLDNAKLGELISGGDLTKIKDYVAQIDKLNVATAKIKDGRNGIKVIEMQLESTGKTATKVRYEFDELTKQLRKLPNEQVFNRNANLGVFEQLRVAMERVPVWAGAMTAFYGSINVVRSMTEEILKLDSAMTELKRVASSSLNVESVFDGAVQLSKELGNNVHDVLSAVNDLARTFGDFNERQLLAITRTAVLMSNVSDLSAQEATESLVGTMNAFNISAEESIHIVDALNEVKIIGLLA
ncbi:phage tail tape measure protein [Priestia megaterium]|uniref:phage tail tape measure protein n=1 Tax=Priestia megaterium TaxID=1404 RepID=UPI000BFCA875|nr:phage tail tape measure protein [Priestia megaterium]PGO60723.1 phage tail tape measure protein [Priestia megaterium]